MAVDVCNEIPSLIASPRISFSYDLNQKTDHIFPLRSDTFPTIDFDFCIAAAAQQISSADELFSNGKILPTQIKNTQETHQPKSNNPLQEPEKKPLKDFLFNTSNEEGDHEDQDQEQEHEDEHEQEKPQLSKSFWKFTRSTSLNFDNAKGKGLLRKLQNLSRSNSTGSAPISKQMQPPKVLEKQSSQKQQPVFTRSCSSSSNSYYYAYNLSKNPPLKKNCRGYNGNGIGIRISPVLNIPPGYGTMSLFGLGSLFCNGKDKKKKK